MDQATQLWARWLSLLSPFALVFTGPGWVRFVQWVTGMVLCWEEHTLTQILTALGLESRWRVLEHFAEYGAWDREAVERQTLRLLQQERPARWDRYHPIAIDDTKGHRTSKQVWGTCTFHESSARSPNRAETATTWAPIGHTPILRRVSKRREWSTVIGLTLTGKLYKRHVEHAIGATEILVALRHFQRHIAGPMIIIWDRLSAHRAALVREYIAAHPEIEVEWLPPYAPDLNPEEGCHGHVKQHLRNAAPTNTREMRAQVDRGFARIRHRPDLILGFFRHAGLHVNQLW